MKALNQSLASFSASLLILPALVITSLLLSNQLLLAQETTANPPQSNILLQVEGVLEPENIAIEPNSSFYDSYTFEGMVGQQVSIVLESLEFDTFLTVLDPNGQIIVQNDDYRDVTPNSAVIIELSQNGTFSLYVSAAVEDARGNYTLTIQEIPEEQQEATFSETGRLQAEAHQLTQQGLHHANVMQYTAAIEPLEQALAIRREINDNIDLIINLTNLGRVHNNLGQPEQALRYFIEALALYQERGDRRGEGRSLTNIGASYFIMRQYEQALRYFTEALTIGRETSDHAIESTVLTNIAGVYHSMEQYEQALGYHRESLTIRQEIGGRQGEVMTLVSLGLTLLRLEQYVEAEEIFYQAIPLLESLWEGNLEDIDKVSLFDSQVYIYEQLQQILITQGKFEEALVIAERGRARVLVESLVTRLPDRLVHEVTDEALNLDEIRHIAQVQNATLVSYSVINSDLATPALYIWVVQPTGNITFQAVSLNQLEQSLADLVNATRQALNIRSRDDATIEVVLALNTQIQQQREILQTLYNLLIEPIAPYLPTNPEDRIIFVPHKSLFLVPFPALMDNNGDYLIEHHTIQTTPSIQLLSLAHQQSNPNLTPLQSEDFLVVGNPLMPSVWNPFTGQNETLSSLPGTELEVLAIQNLFGTRALLWENASEASVVAQMPHSRVIHLATHGLLEYGNPEESGILDIPGAIALTPGNGEDGLLTSAEIFEMSLQAELVVLSACDTGLGNITSDGVIGLSRAFMQAGVPSLIVSLWKVPDEATAFLMTQFYENWRAESNHAQALRQAMLTTMQYYPDPLNWAAFTLIGEAE